MKQNDILSLKTCRYCGKSTPEVKFYGRSLRCNRCKITDKHKATCKKYYDTHKEEINYNRRSKNATHVRPSIPCNIDGYKVCKTCLIALPLDKFGVTQTDCKDCRKILSRNNYYLKISTPEGKAKRLLQSVEWSANNPDKRRASSQKDHARRKGVDGSFTAKEWRDVKLKYGNICLKCGISDSVSKLTVDHVLPISKGGTNYIDNIQPLCRNCNSSKNNKFIDYRILNDETK